MSAKYVSVENYEFDSTLKKYAQMMKNYYDNIKYAKDQVEYCIKRRRSGITDHFYHWHFNHAGVFRRNAQSYLDLAKMYRERLVQMHENAYYDGVSAGKNYDAA